MVYEFSIEHTVFQAVCLALATYHYIILLFSLSNKRVICFIRVTNKFEVTFHNFFAEEVESEKISSWKAVQVEGNYAGTLSGMFYSSVQYC